MIDRARLDAEAAARLLFAAGIVDLVFVFFLLQMTGSLLHAVLAEIAPGAIAAIAAMAPEIRIAAEAGLGLLGFVALLMLYWMTCDLFLGGRSLGRACLMLSPRQLSGDPPTGAQIRGRAMRKLGTLGLTGLSLTRADGYDKASGIVWHSPMAAGSMSATRNWQIRIVSGRYAGQSQTLERLDGFRRNREIRIGRDSNWADIVLDQDEKVSARHARLKLHDRRWMLMDYGGGAGTVNGTRVNGKKLAKGRSKVISVPATLHVADVEIRFERS